MSGFSKEWLALRESADAAARDILLLERMHITPVEEFRVIDLGTGCASNLRYLAPLRNISQHWTLVDADQDLLNSVVAPKIELKLRIEKRVLDLAHDLDALDMTKCNLVTASAFFDLVSKPWVTHLATKCADAKIAYGLFALNVDGRVSWTPQDPDDEEIRNIFTAHMSRDKGFGPALGVHATDAIENCFKAAGYHVFSGDSSWQISSDSEKLQSDFMQGYLQAALEQDSSKSEMIEAWAKRRGFHIMAGKSELVVGHRDVLLCLD